MIAVKIGSDIEKRILAAEKTLTDLGLEVVTHNNLFVVDTKTQMEYNFGRNNSDSFPRFVDSRIYCRE